MASSFCKPICQNSLKITSTIKHASKSKASLLLRDYLRDDLSSCSSSGFKSLPRRQCCTSVGFRLEKDLKLHSKKKKTLPKRRRPALQRASEAVINAVKSLPLYKKSVKTKKTAIGVLSRSFSRKLLSRSFWRKAAKEDGSDSTVPKCRRSFCELLMQERDKQTTTTTSFSEDTVFTTTDPSITTISSGCGSNSWGESEFTFSTSTVASSDSSTENDLVEATKDGALHQHKIHCRGVITGDWQNEKEQFSPVSVLDYPFEDEEEIKSHLSSTNHSLLEGAEHTHMQKKRHFKSIVSLEPVVLEKRMTSSEVQNEQPNYSSKQCSLQNIEEFNARDLLNYVKRSIPSNSLMNKEENLLFDYFKQSNIGENNNFGNSKKLHFCKVAEDWIHGKPQEMYLGWEVQDGRRVYISDMEKCGEWKNSDQETQELAFEMENEVLTSLVNELVLELATSK